MSIDKSYKKFASTYGSPDMFLRTICAERLTRVTQKDSLKLQLGEYIQRVMAEKDLTYKEVERRSYGKVKGGHLNDIVQGRTKNPTVATLKNVAKGLGVPEQELFAVARGQSPNLPDRLKGRFETMILKFGDLPREHQDELEKLIALLDREIDRLSEQ